MAKRNPATLDDLLIQMRITNRLLAAQLRSSMRQNKVIGLLASTGASQQEIADVLDTTPATVNVTLNRLKKKRAAKTSE